MNWYEKGLIELKDNLVETLQKELPDKYKYKIDEFLTTEQDMNIRHAWLVLDSLCHLPDWKPSPVLSEYIEDYCAYAF
jgi:hypothetical protein